VRALIEAARTSSGSLHTGAVAALAEIGDPAAVPALLEMLKANPEDQRAIEALGKLRDPRARAPLRQLLARAKPGTWQEGYLAIALGRLGDA
jgi:HEAT repeat protein